MSAAKYPKTRRGSTRFIGDLIKYFENTKPDYHIGIVNRLRDVLEVLSKPTKWTRK